MRRGSPFGVDVQRRLVVDSIVLLVACQGLRKSFRGFQGASSSPLSRLLMRDGKKSRSAHSFVGRRDTDWGFYLAISFYAVSSMSMTIRNQIDLMRVSGKHVQQCLFNDLLVRPYLYLDVCVVRTSLTCDRTTFRQVSLPIPSL